MRDSDPADWRPGRRRAPVRFRSRLHRRVSSGVARRRRVFRVARRRRHDPTGSRRTPTPSRVSFRSSVERVAPSALTPPRRPPRGRGTPDAQRVGRVAWSCAVGAACRAGRLDRAADLLAEMGEEPFMREWRRVPFQGAKKKAKAKGEGEAGVVDLHLHLHLNASSSSVSRRASRLRSVAPPRRVRAGDAAVRRGRHGALGI